MGEAFPISFDKKSVSNDVTREARGVDSRDPASKLGEKEALCREFHLAQSGTAHSSSTEALGREDKLVKPTPATLADSSLLDAQNDQSALVRGLPIRASVRDHLMNIGGLAVGGLEMLGVPFAIVPYIEEVSPIISRGSRPDVRTPRLVKDEELQTVVSLPRLKADGFKSVINLCAEYDESRAVRAAGMHELHVPMIDNNRPAFNRTLALERIKTLIAFAADPANQPCYIHCQRGVGRTSQAIAYVKMALMGKTAAEAEIDARAHGLQIQTQIQSIHDFEATMQTPELKRFLTDLRERFPSSFSADSHIFG